MGERSDGPASPRLAVVWSVLRAELDRQLAAGGPAAVSILDLGGGSGVFAVPLAKLGHRVTVIDASPDALATLARRATEAGVAQRVRAVQGDVERLPPDGIVAAEAYQLVLCHSLLELVDDPVATLDTVAGALRPGGCASILVAGRAAAVLGRAVRGRPRDALRVLTDPAGRWSEADGVLRRFDTEEIIRLVAAAGLQVEAVHGVGVVRDLISGTALDGVPGAAEALRELELAASARAPYRDIASQQHLLARQSSAWLREASGRG